MRRCSNANCRCVTAGRVTRSEPAPPDGASRMPDRHRRTPPPSVGTSSCPARQHGYLLLDVVCAFALFIAGILALTTLGPVALRALRAQVALSQAVRVASEAAETIGIAPSGEALVSLAQTPAITTDAVHACMAPTPACTPGARFVVIELPIGQSRGDDPGSGTLQSLSRLTLWVQP